MKQLLSFIKQKVMHIKFRTEVHLHLNPMAAFDIVCYLNFKRITKARGLNIKNYNRDIMH